MQRVAGLAEHSSDLQQKLDAQAKVRERSCQLARVQLAHCASASWPVFVCNPAGVSRVQPRRWARLWLLELSARCRLTATFWMHVWMDGRVGGRIMQLKYVT